MDSVIREIKAQVKKYEEFLSGLKAVIEALGKPVDWVCGAAKSVLAWFKIAFGKTFLL